MSEILKEKMKFTDKQREGMVHYIIQNANPDDEDPLIVIFQKYAGDVEAYLTDMVCCLQLNPNDFL